MSETLIQSGSFTTTTYSVLAGATDYWLEQCRESIGSVTISRGVKLEVISTLPYGTSGIDSLGYIFDATIGTNSGEYYIVFRADQDNTNLMLLTYSPDLQNISSTAQNVFTEFKTTIIVYADKILGYVNDVLVGEYSHSHEVINDPFNDFSFICEGSIFVPDGAGNPLSKGSLSYSIYEVPYYSNGSEYSTNRWTDFVNCGERA